MISEHDKAAVADARRREREYANAMAVPRISPHDKAAVADAQQREREQLRVYCVRRARAKGTPIR